MIELRAFDPARDAGLLRQCVIELQETERRCDPRLPPGESMVDAYLHELHERCAGWQGVILVAAENGTGLGIVSIFLAVPETEADEPAGTYALISDLVVLPEGRGRGIGVRLLEGAEDLAREAGAPVLRLEVMAENAGARRFYRRYGWQERLLQLEKRIPRS